MKISSSHLMSLALLGQSLISFGAKAATQLPYFGPDQQNCGVAHPTNEYADYDAGYIASEDCSFIYILPPKFGVFETRPVQYSIFSQSYCGTINENIKGMLTNNETPGTPAYNAAAIIALTRVQNYKTKIKESFTDVEAYASGSASFDWNGLVLAYKDANPHLNSQFTAMPIRAGVLSMASANTTPGLLGEFENELYDVHVSSYVPPIPVENPAVDHLPLYLSFLEGNRTSFIMGQSVGLELRFGMIGACSLRKETGAADSLSGTYTYVYPVQSKGLVRYEFNKDNLIPLIKNFILTHRERFTTNDLAETVKQAKAFNIVINGGAFSDPRIEDQLDDFKADLSAKGTEIMLNLLASQSAISMTASTWVETTTHSQTECHGAWFWKHCDNHVWTTSTSHVDWEKFATDLTSNLAVPDITGQYYKTFYIMSTSAIVPKKGVM